ncbi:hypothetical protein MKEN_01439400 [Mycena kentingensis (nom. inval.)]|nr:hypothetical protein MKEN_01439400 [Mycena kentingensis (nom. inval.)]
MSLRLQPVSIFSALFGALGISTGLYTLVSPGHKTAELFGIVIPPSIDWNSEAGARQKAFMRIHGVRNAVNGAGLVILSLLGARRTVGIMLGLGSLVCVADGWILKDYRTRAEGKAAQVAEKQSVGHMLTAIPVLVLAWFNLK